MEAYKNFRDGFDDHLVQSIRAVFEQDTVATWERLSFVRLTQASENFELMLFYC